jgi:DNA-binding NtrC family response regulator
MTIIVIIDRDLGFMWALAERLKTWEIATIPAGSVQEARNLLALLQPNVSLLIVNCACAGVCSFAQELRNQHPSLTVIGIVSQRRRCRECAQLLIATLSDSEDRSPDQLEQCVELVSVHTRRSGMSSSWRA